MICSYVMGIGEAEAFSERLKRELLALEAANVHAILESEPLIDEVIFVLILEHLMNGCDFRALDEWLCCLCFSFIKSFKLTDMYCDLFFDCGSCRYCMGLSQPQIVLMIWMNG